MNLLHQLKYSLTAGYFEHKLCLDNYITQSWQCKTNYVHKNGDYPPTFNVFNIFRPTSAISKEFNTSKVRKFTNDYI